MMRWRDEQQDKVTTDRRHFLRLGASAAAIGAVPANVRAALAVPAYRKTGTIRDVAHVVILMQENRSFDHYFGCLKGVRGFGDPRAARLPDGDTVFVQKNAHGKPVMPFRLNTVQTSSACIASLDHSWKGTQAAWNAWDGWIPHKTEMTMGYFTRQDIPYYYALAEAFTICDSYHCSIFGPTNPNRLYLFSGTNGLTHGYDGMQAVANVDDGNQTADMRHDRPHFESFRWRTYAEDLQKAGVSWRVYQEYDNFGDNPLASFAAFRNVPKTSWQYQRGRRIVEGSNASNATSSEGRYLLDAFEHDVQNGQLPQVSWIVPPTGLSEHPDAPPGYGEHLISRLMDIFVRHPDVWSKTVFILNYDENDGFFDHVPAPVPALTAEDGHSTVSVEGESCHGVAVGLGPRVPAIIVSPWSKGGRVNSELFDHTSVLRFLEARFGVVAHNITPWRRAVCGDLTSTLDFTVHDPAWHDALPNTDDYLPQTRQACALPRPLVPVQPTMPVQEQGRRRACALPYRLAADLVADQGRECLRLVNRGTTGAVFRLSDQGPARSYTVGAGHTLDIALHPGAFHLSGPNGFIRERSGKDASGLLVSMTENQEGMTLTLTARDGQARTVTVKDEYGGVQPIPVALPVGHDAQYGYPAMRNAGWYALSVEDGLGCAVRFCGHIENGYTSWSDPLMAGGS